MEYKLEDNGSYGHVAVSGCWNADNAKACYSGLLPQVIERRISRLLFDCRDMAGAISTTDRYCFWNHVFRENLRVLEEIYTPPLRIAVIEVEPQLDSSKFGETVARNLGLDIIITEEAAEALRWLGVDDATLK